MSEQIDCNYQDIVNLYSKIGVLEARITKLETAIVQLCNEEEPEVDWAEVAQMRRDNEEGYRDR